MKELIDDVDSSKMMAMILCGVRYKGVEYLIYSIQRSNHEANIFVSKLVYTSDGYIISYDFYNGEKESLDLIVKRILSKEDISSIEKDGYSLIKNIKLAGINHYDSNRCYVSTVSKKVVKDILIYYDLVTDYVDRSPVVGVAPEPKVSSGFVSNLVLIFFGIFIVGLCASILIFMFL